MQREGKEDSLFLMSQMIKCCENFVIAKERLFQWIDVQSRRNEIKEKHKGKHLSSNMLSYGPH